MVYVDFQYYLHDYLGNFREPLMEMGNFSYYAKQAGYEIDKFTYGSLKSQTGVPGEVRDCACELAEFLFKADCMEEQFRQQGATGPLISYSNDGETGSFDHSDSPYTASGKEKKISSIIRKHLSHTGFLYAGVS